MQRAHPDKTAREKLVFAAGLPLPALVWVEAEKEHWPAALRRITPTFHANPLQLSRFGQAASVLQRMGTWLLLGGCHRLRGRSFFCDYLCKPGWNPGRGRVILATTGKDPF